MGRIPRRSGRLDREGDDVALLPALWQAVRTSPSRISRPSAAARLPASRMRCTQNVHFSMTPLSRTVTSGLNCQFKGLSTLSLYEYQLKTRTLYGQLLAQ